jgi:hypothetical protein
VLYARKCSTRLRVVHIVFKFTFYLSGLYSCVLRNIIKQNTSIITIYGISIPTIPFHYVYIHCAYRAIITQQNTVNIIVCIVGSIHIRCNTYIQRGIKPYLHSLCYTVMLLILMTHYLHSGLL